MLLSRVVGSCFSEKRKSGLAAPTEIQLGHAEWGEVCFHFGVSQAQNSRKTTNLKIVIICLNKIKCLKPCLCEAVLEPNDDFSYMLTSLC